jgi:Flp pilus assembly pilin Flp
VGDAGSTKSFVRTFARTLGRWYSDESAQDLVEYAYLSAFVGLAGILVWAAIVTLLGARYADYNTGVQNQWCPPNPDGTATANCP